MSTERVPRDSARIAHGATAYGVTARGAAYGASVPDFPLVPPVHGATALGAEPRHGRHPVGAALRAVKVFASTAASVVVFGEYADDH